MLPASSHASDTNHEDHWENQPGEVCVKVDDKGAEEGGYTVPAEPVGRDWSTLVIKKGAGTDQNDVVDNPLAGQTYFWQGQDKGYSHVILCSIPETSSGTVDACPDMPGQQAAGTSCAPPAPASPVPTSPVPPATPTDIEVLDEAAGAALGKLRVTCQGTVRVVLRNRSAKQATYVVKIAKRTHPIRVGADKERRWVTTAQARQRVQLWQAGNLLASKRLPRACVPPEVLPDTGA